MTFRLPLFVAIIFSAVVFQSCKKDNTIKYPLSDQYFPFKTGNTWMYNVQDTFDGLIGGRIRNYDVVVSMVGVKNLSDGKDAYVMKFQYPDYVDMQFIRIINDTLKVFSRWPESENFTVPKDIFIIPFFNHQYYSSKVMHGFQYNYDVTYPGNFGNYQNVYKIDRSGGEASMIKNSYFIYKPNLGFIEFSYHLAFVDYITDQVWKLKSYNLK